MFAHSQFWLPPTVAFVISFFTSMIGISGGVFLLPFQISVLGLTGPAASATNLVFNIIAVPSGVYRYCREGRILWPVALVIIAGSVPGMFLGALIRTSWLTDVRGRRGPSRPRGAPSLLFRGPLGILAEYGLSSHDVHRGSQSRSLTNRGWQVAGAVMVTGEANNYSGVKPKRAFEPTKGLGHLGGWELKLRYRRVDIDPASFPLPVLRTARSGPVSG